MKKEETKNRVLLMILDGWGLGDHSKSDAIYCAKPEFFCSLLKNYPNSQLRTDGENVGLPDGQMGNSEVGHQNIGAGRVVYQDLVKINRACLDGSIEDNPVLQEAYRYAKEQGKALHLLGLVSDGGVHSSMEHLKKLTEISNKQGITNTYVHCFMDGRDTDPHSGKGFIEELEQHLKATTGKIASIIGRFYAMDRDKRWDRIKQAYDLLIHGKGSPFENAVDAMQSSYDNGVTDEFIKPIILDKQGIIKENDVVIFFNFRNDRARELTAVLTQIDMPEQSMERIPLHYYTMTPYDETFEGIEVIFRKDNVKNTLGEYVSNAGLRQLRIAETEKFAHVTFFFNGGREGPFTGEQRLLIPSPKVVTYDLQPEMSASKIAESLAGELEKKEASLVVLNFANGDMVGHTGVYDAILKAVHAVDNAAKKVVEVAQKNEYTILITADHGNADHAINRDGTPNTAHSLNPVPFILIPSASANEQIKGLKNGILADIAPTILDLMGFAKPVEMTGTTLLEK